jgi:histone-lysine N-methyltransferase SETMAR
MGHQPYSPDLAPCDSSLFGYIKGRLGRRTFPELDGIFQAVDEILTGIPQETFDGVFEDWIRGLRECLERGERYVE